MMKRHSPLLFFTLLFFFFNQNASKAEENPQLAQPSYGFEKGFMKILNLRRLESNMAFTKAMKDNTDANGNINYAGVREQLKHDKNFNMDYDYYDRIIADQEKNSCTAETAKILQENEMFKDYIKTQSEFANNSAIQNNTLKIIASVYANRNTPNWIPAAELLSSIGLNYGNDLTRAALKKNLSSYIINSIPHNKEELATISSQVGSYTLPQLAVLAALLNSGKSGWGDN